MFHKNLYFYKMNQQSTQESIFSSKKFYLYSVAVIAILLLSSPLLFLEKAIPSIWVNSYHTEILDGFFYYITNLGDGLVFIPVLLFLLTRSYVMSAFFAVFVIIEAVFVQLVLKKGLFAFIDRPSAYIPNFEQLHQVTGVDIHSLHSFPSGHTQSVFLVVTFLALLNNKSIWINYLLLLVAMLTALSRVYLLQHFFIDVWFGALIGFSFPVIGIYFLQKYHRFPQSKNKWVINRKNK